MVNKPPSRDGFHEMTIDDYGLDDETQQRMREAVQSVLKRYPLKVEFREDDALDVMEGFALLKGYDAWSVKNALKVVAYSRPFYILAVEVGFQRTVGSKYRTHVVSMRECHLYGFAQMEEDVGRVLIRPENLADKVVELFAPQEVNFPDHKQFCRKYLVLAEHPERVRMGLCRNFLDQVLAAGEVFVEMFNGHLLMTSRRIISMAETRKYCDFFEKIEQS